MEEPIMQFFTYEHLPQHLQDVSKPFGELAKLIIDTLPCNPERTVALRKLLESKDAAVRAKLYKTVDVPVVYGFWVNNVRMHTIKKTLPYEEIVALAGIYGFPQVTYTYPDTNKPGGILARGKSMEVAGVAFKVHLQ